MEMNIERINNLLLPMLLTFIAVSLYGNCASALAVNIRSFNHNETHTKLNLYSLRLPAGLTTDLDLRVPDEFETIVLKARYKFSKRDLLIKALLHGAYKDKLRGQRKDSYEPLDQIGTMALEYIVTRTLIMNSLTSTGAELSKMKSEILNKNVLAFIAIKNNLDTYLFLADNDKAPSSNLAKFKAVVKDLSNYQTLVGRIPEEKMRPVIGDFLPKMMKALIGAVYVDSGFDIQTTDLVFMPMFKSEIETVYNKVIKKV